jgi:hypothetical protein
MTKSTVPAGRVQRTNQERKSGSFLLEISSFSGSFPLEISSLSGSFALEISSLSGSFPLEISSLSGSFPLEISSLSGSFPLEISSLCGSFPLEECGESMDAGSYLAPHLSSFKCWPIYIRGGGGGFPPLKGQPLVAGKRGGMQGENAIMRRKLLPPPLTHSEVF